jgi:signal transduction histidine kinase
MDQVHQLLRRQLRRYVGQDEPIPDAWKTFLEAVNQAYYDFDSQRRMHERALDLSSQELFEANAAEREQRTLAEALRDTASLLSSTLNLEEVLDRILTTIGRVVPHETASVVFLEGSEVRLVRTRGQAGQHVVQDDLHRSFPLADMPNLVRMTTTHQPLIVADTHAEANLAGGSPSELMRSYLGAPIEVDGQVIGFINLNSATNGFFTPLHAERLRAFADQSAIAIKNARLYEHAEELAAMKERQRLARDLHDSVSQTLWTASLIADVLPALWEADPSEAQQGLEKLQRLTRGALAEMRTLLLELRPAALVEVPLGDLLSQLAEAVMSRKKVGIGLRVEGQCSLPPDVHTSIYRLAQESLNNVVKHSGATQIDIDLRCEECGVDLCIRDNGCGFDPSRLSPERLGLGIMRERADTIGARLEISSTAGEGTEVAVFWRASESGVAQ